MACRRAASGNAQALSDSYVVGPEVVRSFDGGNRFSILASDPPESVAFPHRVSAGRRFFSAT